MLLYFATKSEWMLPTKYRGSTEANEGITKLIPQEEHKPSTDHVRTLEL